MESDLTNLQPESRYPKFEVEGTIFTYTESPEQEAWRTVMQVPKELVVATLEGCWRKAITWRKAGSDVSLPMRSVRLSSILLSDSIPA
jgi:hypothetical protein